MMRRSEVILRSRTLLTQTFKQTAVHADDQIPLAWLVVPVTSVLARISHIKSVLSHHKLNSFNCVRRSASSRLLAMEEKPDKSGVFSKRVMLRICRIL